MLEEAKNRTRALQQSMQARGIECAVFTDESSMAYLAGFWGYLGIEFGRPSMVVVKAQDEPIVITPLMESEMVAEMTWVDDVRVWEDFGARTWGAERGTSRSTCSGACALRIVATAISWRCKAAERARRPLGGGLAPWTWRWAR